MVEALAAKRRAQDQEQGKRNGTEKVGEEEKEEMLRSVPQVWVGNFADLLGVPTEDVVAVSEEDVWSGRRVGE